MGVLSGRQIKQFVDERRLFIDPFNPEQTQPASYDLRVGAKILASPTGPQQLGRVAILTQDKPRFDIQPGQMVGVISLEKIRLSLDLCGRFGIRSSFARMGIDAFGGLQLDPGFSGRLIMNLLNVGPEPVAIKLNDVLFTVEFDRLDEAAELPYEGPYQDQDDFPEDQYNYIISARTTSLAEIPALRMEIARLTNVIEELEEGLPDPDAGLALRPSVRRRLEKSLNISRERLISMDDIRNKVGCN